MKKIFLLVITLFLLLVGSNNVEAANFYNSETACSGTVYQNYYFLTASLEVNWVVNQAKKSMNNSFGLYYTFPYFYQHLNNPVLLETGTVTISSSEATDNSKKIMNVNDYFSIFKDGYSGLQKNNGGGGMGYYFSKNNITYFLSGSINPPNSFIPPAKGSIYGVGGYTNKLGLPYDKLSVTDLVNASVIIPLSNEISSSYANFDYFTRIYINRSFGVNNFNDKQVLLDTGWYDNTGEYNEWFTTYVLNPEGELVWIDIDDPRWYVNPYIFYIKYCDGEKINVSNNTQSGSNILSNPHTGNIGIIAIIILMAVSLVFVIISQSRLSKKIASKN